MRWSLWRRNASRVAFEASTPDLPLAPRSPSRPQCCATRRTTDSERWVLRLSQTMSHRVLAAAQQIVEKTCKILLGPPVADHACDLAAGDIEAGDQGLRAVAAILELAPLGLAGLHRQSRRGTLQGLNAGHLVDRDRAMAVIGTGRGLVNLADVGAFGIKGRIWLWRQPITETMGLEVRLFFKKRPTERCEMLGTRPRRIASSAISRWLQWLIGRSLSDGLSQVIAITAQICSGVYVAGAPERGASQSRSAPT